MKSNVHTFFLEFFFGRKLSNVKKQYVLYEKELCEVEEIMYKFLDVGVIYHLFQKI